MKPPTRMSRTCRSPSEYRDKKTRRRPTSPKELKWQYKEKLAIQSALEELKEPKLPDHLIFIQRRVPSRSTQEIEQYLDRISKTTREKVERSRKTFSDSNIKKWMDCCDKQTGVERTCSDIGNGVVNIAHPALALADLLPKATDDANISQYNADNESEVVFEWGKVYEFLTKIMEGRDPFENWKHTCQMESAVILELLEELHNTAFDGEFDRQYEFFFNKFRETPNGKTSSPYIDQPMPDDLFGSKFLNPLGMSKGMCEVIEKKHAPKNVMLEYYTKMLKEGKKILPHEVPNSS